MLAVFRMDWQIRGIAGKSAVSGEAFSPGDRVVCVIFKEPESPEIGRADLLLEELEGYGVPGPVIGRWNRVIKAPDEAGEAGRETVASAEDFFLSLFADEASVDAEPGASAERDALKHLLSLMLERKRILRVDGTRQRAGMQRYIHVKRKQSFDVPIVAISPELVLNIQDTLGDIIE